MPPPVMPLSVRCCLKNYMADLRRSTCGKSLCVSQVITPGMEGVVCVWSVLLRMLKIDLRHCQTAWCLQKLPGIVDSWTES